MDPNAESENAQLIKAIAEVNEEMERAAGDDATLEDIEGAKTLTAELIDRYEDVLKRLSVEEQIALRQRVGSVVEQLKEKLVQLKEAPE